LAIEQVVQLLAAERARPDQVQQDAGIQVAGTRTHHQAFERRHAHAGVDAATVLDCSDARSIAQMAGNDPQLFRRHPQLGGHSVHHMRVTDAVETVATNAETPAQVSRQRILTCPIRQRRVIRSIENGHM
jgi:hypothetical protein